MVVWGDSENWRQDRAGRVTAAERDVFRRAYGENYNPDDPVHGRVRLRSGGWSSNSASDAVKRHEASKQRDSEVLTKNRMDQLMADYRKADAKAKIAKNNSVVGKAKRNLGALKDTLKSVSLKDYTDFYGNLFKKKKKK